MSQPQTAIDTTESSARFTDDALHADVVRAIKTVFDPEIPVDIYELGLIYGIAFEKADDGSVIAHVQMTLTTPSCPAAGELPEQVRTITETVEGITRATVDIVWDPPWDRSMMSEEARLALGFF